MSISKIQSEFIFQVLETISSPVFVKDRLHRWLLVNPAMCQLIGKTSEELIGKSDFDFFPSEQAEVFWQKDEEVFSSNRPVENEEDLTDSHGQSHRIVTKKSCFGSGDDAILVGVIHDVSAQAELARSLEKAKRETEEISQLKSSFLASISHEIRTPMNGVLGMAELLMETILVPEQKEYLDCLLASGKTLLSVVNDVLDFSKVESGRMELSNDPFSVQELVRALELSFQSQFKKRNVDFFCEIEKDIPNYIIGDAARLLQVLTNIVGNSLKFTLTEGMVLVALRSDWKGSKRILNVYVFDSGIGIPEEKQKLIFEPFMQADSGIARTFGGTGLGLSIVLKLVSLMNGELTLRSRQRVGTMVKISLPLQLAEDSSSDNPTLPNNLITLKSQKLDVLIAEDNKINQILIERILQRAGYKTTFAENGEEAIRLNSKNKFDLILMDIQMPILDGQSATQLIRKSRVNNNVPIIALTAGDLKYEAEQYLAIGMNGYVAKPISRSELFAEIERVIKKETPPEF